MSGFVKNILKSRFFYVPLQANTKLKLNMPLKFDATIRYQALDKCFSDYSKFYFIEDLQKEVNEALQKNGLQVVSIRTIRNNIREMINNPLWNVELIEPARKNGQRYYRYVDPQYSIWRRDLNDQQLSQLKSILLMLKQFDGLPQFQRVKEIMRHLEKHYNFDIDSQESIISFETNQYLEGLEHLSVLYEAIVNQQVIKIVYCPFDKPQYTTTINPYFIKQYNNRWFLFGMTLYKGTPRITNLALDRIQTIEITSHKYIPNTFEDFDEYFTDIIGVTKPKDQEEVTIILECTKERLTYIISKPIHESQNNKFAEERLIKLTLIPKNEYYQRILSFGSDVKIIEPAFVQEKMAQIIEKMSEYYNKTTINQ